MIETKSSAHTPRTRSFTWPEVLRAIAAAHTRPDQPLVQATRIRNCHATNPDMVAAELELTDQRLAGITGWAHAMQPQPKISVIGDSAGAVYLMITGVLPAGPTVTVVSWVEDLPLEVRSFSNLSVPMDELQALAHDGAGLLVNALVGAR